MQVIGLRLLVILWGLLYSVTSHGDQPFSKISIHETVFALDDAVYLKASPLVLGLKVTSKISFLSYISSNFKL